MTETKEERQERMKYEREKERDEKKRRKHDGKKERKKVLWKGRKEVKEKQKKEGKKRRSINPFRFILIKVSNKLVLYTFLFTHSWITKLINFQPSSLANKNSSLSNNFV